MKNHGMKGQYEWNNTILMVETSRNRKGERGVAY